MSPAPKKTTRRPARRATRKKRKLGRYLLPAVVLLVIPLVFQEVMYGFRYLLDVQPHRSAVRANMRTFLDDHKALADELLLIEHRGTSNAKSYLHPRLQWTQPDLGRDSDRQITGIQKLELPETLKAKIKAWGPQFPRYHSSISYGAIDFTWLAELKRFDYWDPLAGAKLDSDFYLNLMTSLYLTQMHVKDFEEFLFWAKLRLMQGLHEGRLELATQETRHLAQLLYSTETLMGAMTAIAILRAEIHVGDYLNASLQARGNWEPFDREQVDRHRRVILGYNALYTLFTPEDDLRDAFEEPLISLGLCSGLAKGLFRSLLARKLLEPKATGERGYAKSFEVLEDAYDSSKDRCRLTGIRDLWERQDSRGAWRALYGTGTWDWIHVRWIQHVPYLRRMWGIDLASMYLSNGFQSYSSN